MDVYAEGIENLARAIIVQAADDYRMSRRVLCRDPYDFFANCRLFEVTRFFQSDWYCIMSEFDGERLMGMLDDEFDTWKDAYDNRGRIVRRG